MNNYAALAAINNPNQNSLMRTGTTGTNNNMNAGNITPPGTVSGNPTANLMLTPSLLSQLSAQLPNPAPSPNRQYILKLFFFIYF